MRKSLEIEKADNGFVVTVYGEKEMKEENTSSEAIMYPEPKKIVAKKEELAGIVTEWAGK